MIRNNSKISPIIFIAIDGKGGAGKSTLASSLSKVLNAEIIHTDDFTTFDHPAFDGSDLVLEKVFNPIIKGSRSLTYDRLQVWPGEPTNVTNQKVTDIMLIEGCGVSCQKFRPYLSYTILTELDDDTRIKRIIERDVVEGGRSEDDNAAIGRLWEEKENEYFEKDDPSFRADLIVDSTEIFSVKEIVKKLN